MTRRDVSVTRRDVSVTVRDVSVTVRDVPAVISRSVTPGGLQTSGAHGDAARSVTSAQAARRPSGRRHRGENSTGAVASSAADMSTV